MEAGVRGEGIDPCRVAVDPISHRSIGIVIIRIHAGVAAHLVAVPALPHGGGAMPYQVSPGGILGVEQQMVGDIAMSRIHQHCQQIRRTQKSGSQASMVGLDLGDQPVGRCSAQRIGHQLHIQRQHISGLGIPTRGLGFGIVDLSKGRRPIIGARDETVGMNILCGKGSLDLAE